MGFAGLQQTTVERLLREGGSEAADARASDRLPAAVVADARHVLGGECPAAAARGEEAMNGAAGHLRTMQRTVVEAGGRASALFNQLSAAHAYAAATSAHARTRQPQSAFSAYLRVVGGDLEPPESRWSLSGAGDAREEERAREELAVRLAGSAVAIGEWCRHAQGGWQQAAQGEIAWREALEAQREMLRVCMRAWREVADGVQAGAARFEQVWARGPPSCRLARRLTFSGTRARADWQATAWPAALMLAWMRLVRAGEVHAARRRSSAWHEQQVSWHRHLNEAMRDAVDVPVSAMRLNERDARASAREQPRAAQQAQEQRQKAQQAARRAAARDGPCEGCGEEGDGDGGGVPMHACRGGRQRLARPLWPRARCTQRWRRRRALNGRGV